MSQAAPWRPRDAALVVGRAAACRASIAGLPASSACVLVRPPLSASGADDGVRRREVHRRVLVDRRCTSARDAARRADPGSSRSGSFCGPAAAAVDVARHERVPRRRHRAASVGEVLVEPAALADVRSTRRRLVLDDRDVAERHRSSREDPAAAAVGLVVAERRVDAAWPARLPAPSPTPPPRPPALAASARLETISELRTVERRRRPRSRRRCTARLSDDLAVGEQERGAGVDEDAAAVSVVVVAVRDAYARDRDVAVARDPEDAARRTRRRR